MIDYTLSRSKRKTFAIYIKNGAVEVRAPLKAPKSAIDKFVASRENWIKEKLALSNLRLEQRGNFNLDYGDTVIFRGAQYPIAAKDGNRIGFDDKRFYMPPGLAVEYIKKACIDIYRLLAKRHLTARVQHYAALMSVAPLSVRINGAKTRWGSCSAKKSINFSWRLIMADDDIIDYVVVHELAHLIELNHSERFWAIVKEILPDVQAHKMKLKKLQNQLSAENWD